MKSMSDSRMINVVLGGSGTAFPAYIGCYKALLEKELTIKGIVGTSGGALIAASIAMKLSPNRMIELSEEFFAKFKMPNLVEKIWNAAVYGGLVNLNTVKKFLDSTELKDKTFRDLYKTPALYIAATRMDPLELKIFSREHSSELEVNDALTASLAIPGFFSPKKIKKDYYQDGVILGGNLLVDFFVSSNYPTIAFKTRPNKTTAPKFNPLFIKSLSKALEGLLLAPELEKIEDAPNAKIIYIDVPYSALDFDLDYEKINTLVKAGYSQASEALNDIRVSSFLSL